YTGRKPVIPSSLADTSCDTLSVQGLLDQLNTTLATSHSLDNSFLSSLLEYLISDNCDFDLAYSHLRQIWYTDDWSTIKDVLWKWRDEDGEERRKALVGNRIVNSLLPPRRVWDLPNLKTAYCPCQYRTAVWTPINGYEWPVPIPKDADLNLIRIEMLNLGHEHTWLDVLCLRQEGGQTEDLRTEEWKLDVPTIGNVYGQLFVVCYLSGLGHPLTLKEGDLESDRSWFRRAWTLQETARRMLFAGDTPDGPLHAECKDGEYATELLARFHKQREHACDNFFDREALVEMRNRISTNPVDKIAGLAKLTGCGSIPAYYKSMSLEDAWTALGDPC
ncbi:hypothetical protein IW261DRAFT_1343013, partial [Armillaria novae-zelandiae]